MTFEEMDAEILALNDLPSTAATWRVFAKIGSTLLHEDDFDSADAAYDVFVDMICNDLAPAVIQVTGPVRRDVTADMHCELGRIIDERGLAPDFDDFGARCDYRRALAAE